MNEYHHQVPIKKNTARASVMVQNIFELGNLRQNNDRTQDIVDSIYRNLKNEVEAGKEFLSSKVTFEITISVTSVAILLNRWT